MSHRQQNGRRTYTFLWHKAFVSFSLFQPGANKCPEMVFIGREPKEFLLGWEP